MSLISPSRPAWLTQHPENTEPLKLTSICGRDGGLYIRLCWQWRHKQHEATPADIISIVEQRTEAGATTPTLSSPIPDKPPYHTQMFPIKGTHKPLHPEYVNQDKDPFKHRVSENCTLLLSFSFFYNTHFKSASCLFFPPRGHICLERQEQKHVSRMSVKDIRKLTRKGDNTRVVFGWGGNKKRMIE